MLVLRHIPSTIMKKGILLGLTNSCVKICDRVLDYRCFSSTSVLTRLREKSDRKSILSSVGPTDEGAEGEKSIEIDKISYNNSSMFPDKSTPLQLYDGVSFQSLHVCHIRVSKNNTKFSMTDHTGLPSITWTCGTEGFKNTKKGTNIAAQAAAVTFCMRAKEQGIKTVRVKIGGLGPGRMASIKGLQMGGLNIISITDTTPAPEDGPRPKKQKHR